MAKPNNNFHLSVRDIDLIEVALRNLPPTDNVLDLLGRLHHQKTWYGKNANGEPYVSG
jgi:hypothetical protein